MPDASNIWVAGVDEAGRGPLAGDVFAAAVILDESDLIAGLADSKKLSAQKRENLAIQIKQRARAWAIASASVHEIDTLNILQATLLAMQRAISQLPVTAHEVLIDGNRAPRLDVPVRTIVGGDALVPSISAASILAKTARDESLRILHHQYPHYAFDRHKGYGTALHLAKLKEFGPCPAHRRSFAPVRALLERSDGQVIGLTLFES